MMMDTNKPVTAALIGMGAGAEKIMLPGLTSLPQVNLVAACDLDAANRERVAAKWGIPQTFADPAEMLTAVQPNIAVIAAPPLTHFELGQLALAHGCHLYCEKPFMPTLAEADQIIAQAAAKNLQVGVNSQYYQMPIFRQLQEQIDGGAVGRVFQIDAWQQMYLLPHEEGGWKAALQPRRVLFEFGTHAIDLMCRFFDATPQAVTARIAQVRADIDADVCINVRLDFPEGRIANFTFNRMSYAPMRYFEMRLNGEKAALRASLGGLARLDLGWNSQRGRPRVRFSLTKGGEARLEKNGEAKLLANQADSAYGDAAAAHFGRFATAVQQGQPPEPSVQHAREILRVLLACYESAENEGALLKL